MKMIYISCDVTVVEELIELLESTKIENYQVIEKITAKSQNGVPRFNNAVWPGYNSAIFIQIDNEQKSLDLIVKLREFNKKIINQDELLTVCSWNLDEYFND